jgi:hypothetical protein
METVTLEKIESIVQFELPAGTRETTTSAEWAELVESLRATSDLCRLARGLAPA